MRLGHQGPPVPPPMPCSRGVTSTDARSEVHCSAPKLCHTSGCIITIHVYMHALMLCLLSAINALDAEQHSFHLPRAAPVTSDARAAHSACMAGGGHSEQSGAIF